MGSTAHGGDGTFSYNFFLRTCYCKYVYFLFTESIIQYTEAITYNITTYSFLQQCRDLFNFNWFHMLTTL